MSKILASLALLCTLGCAAPQLAVKNPLVAVAQPCVTDPPPPDQKFMVLSHEPMKIADPETGQPMRAPDGSGLYGFITSEDVFKGYFLTCNGRPGPCGYIESLQNWARSTWQKCGPRQVEVK